MNAFLALPRSPFARTVKSAMVAVGFCCALCILLVCAGGRAAWATPVQGEGGAPPSLASALSGKRFSATRPVLEGISEEDAIIIAETAARGAAMQTVIRALVTLPEIQIAGSISSTPVRMPSLLALAGATAKTSPLLVSRSRKDSTVTVTIVLDGDGDGPSMEFRVRDALVHPDRLDLYGKAMLREAALLDAYNAPLPPGGENHAHAASTPKNMPRAANGIVNEIKALATFKAILPSHTGLWKDPAAVRETMLAALSLAPQSALCRNAMGDASLQLGRSQEAMEEQSLAIRADPAFARAYLSRGAAALALGLQSAAIADFSEAIRLSPQTASHYRARGMARHLAGETDAMCQDLHQACTLGECNEFQWAVSNSLCDASKPLP